jgi:hypothetical protein
MARRKPNPEQGWRSYGPGKFDSMVDSFLWSAALDGSWEDEQVGESEGFGYYSLVVGDIAAMAEHGAEETGDDITPDERDELKGTAAVIMSENSQGFVGVDYFDTEKDARKAWADIEEAYNEFESEGDDEDAEEDEA